MENVKRIYPSQQLVCCLDARVLKTLMWLMGWQSQGEIKVYVHQMSRFLHMDEEVIELCIQTLVDTNLITLWKKDEQWLCTLNGEQIQKYFKIPMEKIKDGNGIPMAKETTWNKTLESSSKQGDIADLSTKDLQRLLLRIEAQLSEREQVKKVVVTPEKDNDINDLPF